MDIHPPLEILCIVNKVIKVDELMTGFDKGEGEEDVLRVQGKGNAHWRDIRCRGISHANIIRTRLIVTT
jgi:hypothetical protein